MNIAVLVGCLPPVIDGVGEYTFHLTRSLRKLGVDAHIFTSKNQTPPLEFRNWIHPVISQWTGAGVAQAVASLSAFKPDWCCFQYVPQMYSRNGICWQASGIPLALKQRFKWNIAVTFHEFISEKRLNPKDWTLATVIRSQAKRLLAGCDLAITTCDRYARSLQSLTPKKLPIRVIPVGANIRPIPMTSSEILSLRKHYSLNESRVFGLFGRLSSFRNYPTALYVLKQAKQRGLNAHLMVIGCAESSHPSLFAELMQLAQKLDVERRLIVTGELSTEAVSQHLQLVDLFLFPQTGGISTRNTTVMTALSHGLPVIAYQPPAGNFEGHQIPYGALVPLQDEACFIQIAVEFMKTIHDRPSRKDANVKYFENHFSWPGIGRRYLEAFRTGKGVSCSGETFSL